ncbi:PepSY domain-containing protein [Streptomyces sp. NPDC005955]|uniref:PepSY domain-containing protein n=1 Tax=Streptomyces sp. NPDC005955 TaxID=3364738 RepID=UPI0036ADD494
MKRKVLIAAITGALLVGTGTATAVAVAGADGGDDDRTVQKSSVQLTDDAGDDNDDRDDKDDREDDREDDRADDRDGRDDDREDTGRLPAGVKVTAADAIATALGERSGTAVSVDLDEDDGKVAWDIEVIDGKRDVYTVVVDPGTGKVLGSSLDKDDSDDKDDRNDTKNELAVAKGAAVSAQQAAEVAAAKGTVISLDLDEDGKKGAWDVEVLSNGTERDWTVSLDTAKTVPAKDTADSDDSDGSDD